MNDLRVAAVVMRSGFGEVKANLEKIRQFARQAAAERADIVCFPEMSITGYALKKEIECYAEPLPGPSSHEVQRMAKDNGIAILAGLAEKSPSGAIAITQIIAFQDGEIGIYRKLHLSQGEQEIFQAGSEVRVFSIGETVCGVQLCYDAHFPELSTLQALKGAEVLFMPHASPPPQSPDEKRDRWLRYLAARAYDNSVYVVACNQTGDGGVGIRFSGVALILDTRGEVLGEISDGEERMLIADLQADALARTRKTRMGFFLAHRRPELYADLSSPVPEGIVKKYQ